MPSQQAEPAANILVVDDTPANLQLLAGMLKERGYRVRPVSSGEMALRAIEAQTPDLILLDITMPGMDGYEICRRLKTNERWRDVPVLFISALNDTEDKIRAFQAGGVDYVTKPFQFEEVDARVRTHLELRRQRQLLKENLIQLHKLEALRDNLTHMIVHDMRSPLMAIRLAIEMLTDLRSHPNPDEDSLLDNAQRSIDMLIEMSSQILDISRMESGQMKLTRTPTDLNELAAKLLESLRPLAGRRHLELVTTANVTAQVDADILRRVVTNLVVNAIKFTREATGEVSITLSRKDTSVQIFVKDNGPGIDPEFQQRMFDKFAQAESPARKAGTGLGLTFVKMAVETHGGSIQVTSNVGKGTVFSITLPDQ